MVDRSPSELHVLLVEVNHLHSRVEKLTSEHTEAIRTCRELHASVQRLERQPSLIGWHHLTNPPPVLCEQATLNLAIAKSDAIRDDLIKASEQLETAGLRLKAVQESTLTLEATQSLDGTSGQRHTSILGWLIGRPPEGVIGDIEEEFRLHWQSNRLLALEWLIRQSLGTFFRLIIDRLLFRG